LRRKGGYTGLDAKKKNWDVNRAYLHPVPESSHFM